MCYLGRESCICRFACILQEQACLPTFALVLVYPCVHIHTLIGVCLPTSMHVRERVRGLH